jgi:hypothetical protein
MNKDLNLAALCVIFVCVSGSFSLARSVSDSWGRLCYMEVSPSDKFAEDDLLPVLRTFSSAHLGDKASYFSPELFRFHLQLQVRLRTLHPLNQGAKRPVKEHSFWLISHQAERLTDSSIW